MIITSIETQLLSRSRPYDTTMGWTGRYLHLPHPHPHPQVEVEGAAALTEKGYLEVTYTSGSDRYYDLTPTGLAYFHATWPNRQDRP